MDKFISELHYYLRQNLWHTAIDFCTEELDKGRDPYVSFWRGFAYSQEGSLIEAILINAINHIQILSSFYSKQIKIFKPDKYKSDNVLYIIESMSIVYLFAMRSYFNYVFQLRFIKNRK